MEWLIGIYALGACVMAGLLAYIVLSGREKIGGWAGFAAVLLVSAFWPATVAWLAVAACMDWRAARRRRAAKRPRRTYGRRWSDNERRWGPFTYANENSEEGNRQFRRLLGAILYSGDDDGRRAGLRLHLLGRTLIVDLPPIIRPWRQKAYPGAAWSAETVARLGRDWYWDVKRREYGFVLYPDALHYDYGVRTHSSNTDCSGVWFLPWRAWRHVRFSIFDFDGKTIWSQHDADRPKGPALGGHGVLSWYDQQRVAEEAAPKREFEFLDFDKERLVAMAQIHEREWHLGEGGWKWLAWFVAPRVIRTLSLTFSGETGRRKGSWKGGTIGSGIEMLPGETAEAAFARYAARKGMTYPPPPRPVRIEPADGPVDGTGTYLR